MADVISKITLPDNHQYNLKDSGAARSDHTHDISITTTAGVTTTNLLGSIEQLTFTGDADAEVQIFDGNHGTLNRICPLSTNTNWTLAIDYKFIIDTSYKNSQTSEFVLASC